MVNAQAPELEGDTHAESVTTACSNEDPNRTHRNTETSETRVGHAAAAPLCHVTYLERGPVGVNWDVVDAHDQCRRLPHLGRLPGELWVRIRERVSQTVTRLAQDHDVGEVVHDAAVVWTLQPRHASIGLQAQARS